MRKKRGHLRELTIPPAADRGRESIELIRAWIVDDALYGPPGRGVWAGGENLPEPIGWGVLLADIARHVANALQKSDGRDRAHFVRDLRQVFNNELDEP